MSWILTQLDSTPSVNLFQASEMAGLNAYFRCSKIGEAKFRQVVRCFALDLTAMQAAKITGLSVRPVNAIFLRMPRKIAAECERDSLSGEELEADESYFGPRRVRGKRGCGAAGKTIVFGLLKRGQQVYTEIVPDASKAALQAIIRGKARPESILHTDGWHGYDARRYGQRCTSALIQRTLAFKGNQNMTFGSVHTGRFRSMMMRQKFHTVCIEIP